MKQPNHRSHNVPPTSFVTISLSLTEDLINDSDWLAESEGISRAIKLLALRCARILNAAVSSTSLSASWKSEAKQPELIRWRTFTLR